MELLDFMFVPKVQDLKQFKTVIKERFGENNIRGVDSDSAFSVFLDTSEIINKTIIVGRYNKSTQIGSIFDRRGNHEQDNNTLSKLLKESPRRRKTDNRKACTSNKKGENYSLQVL